MAVRSSVGVEEADYRLWDTHGFSDRYGRNVGGRTRKLFEEAGGRLIVAPALAAGANAVAEAMSLTYGDAVTYRQAPWKIYDAANVRNWLNSWMDQLRSIADTLGMEDVECKAY
ncbi:hypothetical protein ACM61V_16390 [Sphingomonas sp. TX0543]|uniref:hypothetical protein n=1 Tax=Sphingomonas sp. TX0543 TaxID=3399682 RepID=UPI003AFB3A81